jgi:hypothetical protein
MDLATEYHASMAPGHTRRGRPPSSPSERDDHRGRIGWLLRVNRLYGRDETASVQADFARRLAGTAYGRGVDGSAITRWEKGGRPVSRQAIRGYEQILGLPGHSLVAVADAAWSLAGESAPRSATGPDDEAVHRRTTELLNRATGGDLMSGADWADLVGNLPRATFMPGDTWTTVAERLLSEMIISESTGWLQRNEALTGLLRHRDGARPVIRAVADLTNDPTNQVFVDPLTLLETVRDPEATDHLLRQLAAPTNEHALRGAWCAAAEKIRRGHFGPAELEELSRRAAGLLTDVASHPGCRVAATELLRQNRAALNPKVAQVLQRAAAGDAVTRHVLRRGRTEAAEAATTVVDRLARDAAGRMPREGLSDDATLERLIEEMLFHPQISRRLLAAQFVEASPYRRPLAAALQGELRRVGTAPASLICAVLAALSTLGDHESRRAVQGLVLATGLPAAVTEAAAWALGHMRGESPGAFWAAALELRVPGGRLTPEPLGWSTARGLVYGLGVSRNTAMLRQLSVDRSNDPAVRAAASWWLRTPRHVLDSTKH